MYDEDVIVELEDLAAYLTEESQVRVAVLDL